ncbi:unnamed protein product [Parascedosporium putredinis]|uniref:Uncharacterized protein n=1 Tax=Parascedosporium putredinis TaxID=1442378 RepID=A0A9P1MCG6_9PEZI|nr:unnamed protein product [Parascedosporium putredinis]CAI7997816.1 unnamed protein product [Parascedosporium putredinis]
MAAPKVLILGGVNGQLKAAFGKIAALQTKNNFSLLLITGNLFGEDDDDDVTALLNGEISVALPTYFTVGTTALPPRICQKVEADEEICENLHFLGKRSVTKTSEGVRIVALGGVLDETIVAGLSTEQHLPLHTAQDATSLKGAQSADILLTTMWPQGIMKGTKVPLGTGHAPDEDPGRLLRFAQH